MIKINLNPYKKKKAKIALPKIRINLEKFGEALYFVPPILLITLTVVFTYYQSQIISSLKEEKEKLLTEKKKYKTVEIKINKLNKKYTNLKDILYQIDLKKSIYNEISKQKEDFGQYFNISYSSIPDGIWLKSLYISRNKFEFEGYSLDPLKVSELYKNLGNYFENINFKSVERKSNKLNSFYSFKIITNNLRKGI